MLDQSEEVVAVVESRDVVDVVESLKKGQEKKNKDESAEGVLRTERSGGIRMAETKSKERNVEAVKADDDEVEARANGDWVTVVVWSGKREQARREGDFHSYP